VYFDVTILGLAREILRLLHADFESITPADVSLDGRFHIEQRGGREIGAADEIEIFAEPLRTVAEPQ
jgi:hypothetical protein